MKSLITLVALTFTSGAFAQESVVLSNETTLVNNSQAVLVRTAATPEKVSVLFNVPMTNTVCTKYKRTGSARRRHRTCIQSKLVTSHQADKVKITFKDLPALGGSEEETFKVVARQKNIDSQNVIYKISTLETTAPYAVVSKGVLGIDSFSIELK